MRFPTPLRDKITLGLVEASFPHLDKGPPQHPPNFSTHATNLLGIRWPKLFLSTVSTTRSAASWPAAASIRPVRQASHRSAPVHTHKPHHHLDLIIQPSFAPGSMQRPCRPTNQPRISQFKQTADLR